MRTNLFGADERLVKGDGLHALGAQALESTGVLAKIEFGADQDDRNIWGVVVDLREPLPQKSAKVKSSKKAGV